MPPATGFHECRAFAAQIRAAGAVPDSLQRLLSAYDLFSSQQATGDPIAAIVAQAADGTLSQKQLDDAIARYATEHQAALMRIELRERADRLLTAQFHKALKAGAADAVLDSMRPAFDKIAAELEHARSLIFPGSSAEHVIASGDPGLVAAWQSIDANLAVVGGIAAVAAQFGCRPTASFPQVKEFANADGFRINDYALTCTTGPLEQDSALFERPDQGHRTSPWFRLPLRLHTIDEARERYRQWAEAQWDAQHSGQQQSWIDDNGQAHEMPRPVNPYRAKLTTA